MKMIITPNKFAILIEETVKTKKMSYMDAILWYCEKNGINYDYFLKSRSDKTEKARARRIPKGTRNMVLRRDNFQCQDCNEKSNELHVHHNYYIKDSMPWEIDDSALTSLCKKCHTIRHEKEDIKVYKK